MDIDPGGIVVIFAKKQEKNCKKIISKRNNLKKKEKIYEKCEYCNKNLNELGMNDASRAYKNRLYKAHINLKMV